MPGSWGSSTSGRWGSVGGWGLGAGGGCWGLNVEWQNVGSKTLRREVLVDQRVSPSR